MKKIIYSAIVFNSKNILDLIPPKFSNIYANHTTLFFGNQEKPEFNGQIVNIKFLNEYSDFNCQTIEVDILNENIKLFYNIHNINNSKPHITISTNSNIKPVYSNNFFTNKIPKDMFNIIPLNKNIIISGVVGCFLKDKTWDFSKCF